MGIQTIKDIELKNKTVLVRADYNVPLKNGKIADDYRLQQSIPTLKSLLEAGVKKLVIISHLGRPAGPQDKDCSLKPVAKRLAELLDKPVTFIDDCVGEHTKQVIAEAPAGSVLLLENLRFHAEEEKNDEGFAKALADASGADLFVQDGFGVVHRAHASTDAIARILPAVAGLLLAHEIEVIEGAMKDPKRPLVAIVGGAKIIDKIDVLERFIEIADLVAVGGALANDFLKVEKVPTGKSLVDNDALDTARRVLAKARKAERERNFNFLVPIDAVVAKTSDGKSRTRLVDLTAHAVADIQSYPKKPDHHDFTIASDEMVLDIGPLSAAQIAGAVKLSATVIWSGTLGMAEVKGLAGAADPFGHGTRLVVEAMIGTTNQHAHKPFSIVGGGDTVSYVQSRGLVNDFNHVSTGGSASLELMAGHKLPGIEVLKNIRVKVQ